MRRPGAIRIDAWKRAGPRRDAALRIRATQAGPRLRVFDVYPPPRGGLRECYPQPGERGAFWDSDSAVKIVLSIPEGVEFSAFIMGGEETPWRPPIRSFDAALWPAFAGPGPVAS